MTLINKYFIVEANCDGEFLQLCFYKDSEQEVKSWNPRWIGTLIKDLKRGLDNEGSFSLLLPSVRSKAMCYGLIHRIANLDISKNREEELAYIEWASKVISWNLVACYGTGLDESIKADWDLGVINSIDCD